MKPLTLLLVFLTFAVKTQSQVLKSVIYDFDGLTIGQTDLPDEDFRYGDLTFKVNTNPTSEGEVIGDRVLQLNLNWNTGLGAFGQEVKKFIELNIAEDKLNFYFYNPASNGQNALLDILIVEDDNQNNNHDQDDVWKTTTSIPTGIGWQLIVLPLNAFTDNNSDGNGIFDATFSGNKGMILQMEFKFRKDPAATTNATFYIDMICLSKGDLPHGATILDLPHKNQGGCSLGAFQPSADGEQHTVPGIIEGYFPPSPGKHLKYVNWFVQFATDGSSKPKDLPGNEVQLLIDKGYTPIITWEPMFKGFDRLDPVQPRLKNIINGDYDSYIDAFGDRLKAVNGTLVVRLMHEFEGDWYSWSLVYNKQDPNEYITAYRRMVDRVRARGATNVKWMWCVNGDYFPRKAYNWIVPAYPGDNYVDIVASDIYNNHTPIPTPSWKSFKVKAAETYYYLTQYFPQKPMFICELGCRERYNHENPGSESKAKWLARMDKELQSNFGNVKGLLFFSAMVVFDWRVNSSPETIQAISENIWNDNYYFSGGSAIGIQDQKAHSNIVSAVYKPFNKTISVDITSPASIPTKLVIRLFNLEGQEILSFERSTGGKHQESISTENLPAGMYIVSVFFGEKEISQKIILN